MFMTVLKCDFETMKTAKYPMFFNNKDFLHKWVTSQFHLDRLNETILYRVDHKSDGIYLYVQSKDPFPRKNLENAGMRFLFSFELQAGNDFPCEFQISCTPNVSRNKKKLFIKDQDGRIEWLKQRLAPFMSNLYVAEMQTDKIDVKKKDGTTFSIPYSEFKGYGIITDKDAFLNAVQNGFGYAKNYGMGLMIYKPVA